MRRRIHVGLDIGGTLAKVVTVMPGHLLHRVLEQFSDAVMLHEKFSADEHDIKPQDLGFSNLNDTHERFEFTMFCFSSRDISALLEFIELVLGDCGTTSPLTIPITGGGAIKFRSELKASFPEVNFLKVDEMEAVAAGFSFLVRRPNAAFIFNAAEKKRVSVPMQEVDSPFPLLLVNIGSGVSMIRIDGPGRYARVQGSPIGGGTVIGLGKALFDASSFKEIMQLSVEGDSSRVDLSVGELIGASPDDEFWNFNTLASSLSKLNTLERAEKVSRADLAQSLVRMVSYNIGYVAYLVSCLHDCNRIYFSGKYVNEHIPTMEAISYAVKFYENWKPPPAAEGSVQHDDDSPTRAEFQERKCEVRFLHHEGYVGAIGALLASRDCYS